MEEWINLNRPEEEIIWIIVNRANIFLDIYIGSSIKMLLPMVV